MRLPTVSDIRQHFIEELKNETYTSDKSGVKTIELIGAQFHADEPSIFGTVNHDYVDAEINWYRTGSTNIHDIYEDREPPVAWKYSANKHGEINSNYGHLIWSEKYFQQYEMALDELLRNPDTRRATMVYNRPSVWVEYNENGKNDFICTNAVSYYIRNGQLSCVVQMRSNDVVYGYKNDYAWQQHVLSQLKEDYNALSTEEDQIEIGDIIWQVQNLHVYEKHFDLVK